MKALALEEDMLKQAGINQTKAATVEKDKPLGVDATSVVEDYHYSEVDILDKGKSVENTYSEPLGGWDGPVTLFAGYDKEKVEEHDFR